jgi:DNA-binding transcriptional LysR family regulator
MPSTKSLERLNWDDLRLFLAVARAGSLVQASRKLGFDISTVSRRLVHLEESLGGILFERSRSGLKKTALAEDLIVHAQRVESGVIGLLDAALQKGISGVVRVAMMEGFGSLYLSRKITPFIAANPNLQIELVTSPCTVNVTRREADIFLSFFELNGRGLHCKQIGEFSLFLYGSKEYLSQYGRPADVIDLTRHQFVTYVDDLIQVDAVRWLSDVIDNPSIAVYSSSMVAQMSFAEAGAGLVLLPRFALPNSTTLEVVLPDLVRVTRPLFLSAPQDLVALDRVRSVMDFICSTVEQDQKFLLGK